MNSANKVGFYSSLLMAILTIISLGLAMTAVPISGAFCPEDCIEYPYLDTLQQFPGDFIWMYFAMFMMIAYLIFMVSLNSIAPKDKQIFSQIGL